MERRKIKKIKKEIINLKKNYYYYYYDIDMDSFNIENRNVFILEKESYNITIFLNFIKAKNFN